MPRFPIHDPKREENENVDICADCWKKHVAVHDDEDAELIAEKAGVKVDLVHVAFTVEDTQEGCEHPNYDGEDYICQLCRSPLTSDDN